MEPATIAVLVITAAFLGLCVWIERNSRRQQAASNAPQAESATLPVEEQPQARKVSRLRKRARR